MIDFARYFALQGLRRFFSSGVASASSGAGDKSGR
jgi:hypothetical protein